VLDRLFCYGTLCVPEIMHQIVGRKVLPVKASLRNYACYGVRNRHYPAAVYATGESISGMLYTGLTARELALLDRYEGIEYRRLRVGVTMHDGKQAQSWVYVLRPQYASDLSDERWSLEEFIKTQAENYWKALAAEWDFRHPARPDS
jgi:gamma-glutamylcyclotransferase (GGCT)/AIG2-like uncharacterized protein YtfP